VALDDGAIVRSDERARGRVSVAVYPWEVGLHAVGNGPVPDGMNTISAPITALMPEEGHVRVRIGALTAESSREELDSLGLQRGCVARACFAPAHTRLIALEAD
jgi:hypothetical protein